MAKLCAGGCSIVLTLALLSSPAQAQVDTRTSSTPTSSSSGSQARREVCLFRERADNPHFSHTVAGNLNVHGWWEWSSGTSASCKSKYPKAKVTVYLQSSLDGKKWTTRADGAGTVKAGGGSGNWAYAPFTCKNSLLTKWRGLVDVDVLGLVDDPGKVAGNVAEQNCGY